MLRLTERTTSKLAVAGLSLFPGLVFAEVSDKVPAAELFWIVGIPTALLCLFSARIKPVLGAIGFLPAALWFGSVLLEIHSADLGPPLRTEAGLVYYLHAYTAFGVVVCGFILGIAWHRCRSGRSTGRAQRSLP